MTDTWYYVDNATNSQKGPCTILELGTLLASSAKGDSTLVWKEGKAGREELLRVPSLHAQVRAASRGSPPPTPAKAFPPLPAKPATSGGWAGGAGGAYAAAQVNPSVVQSMSGESLDAVTFCEFYAFLARKALHVLQGSTSHCTAQSALGLRNNNDDVPISCYVLSVTSIKRRLRYPECMYAQHLLRLECCPLLFLLWAVRPPPIPFAHPYGFSDIFFTLQYYYCLYRQSYNILRMYLEGRVVENLVLMCSAVAPPPPNVDLVLHRTRTAYATLLRRTYSQFIRDCSFCWQASFSSSSLRLLQ